MKQNLIFTALPNGINPDNNHLKLSVAISLQVTDTAAGVKLAFAPDMLDWATLINNAKFVVQVNGTAIEAIKTSAPADTALWRNLFTPNIKINPFVVEDKTNVPILSYPVKHILSHIKSVVVAAGQAAIGDMPIAPFYTSNPLFTDVSTYVVRPYQQDQREKTTLEQQVTNTGYRERVRRLLGVKPFVPFSTTADAGLDFAQLGNFHGINTQKPVASFTPFDPPEFEFHEIVSVLTQYPKLMKRLGLVVDLEVPNQSVFAAAAVPTIRAFPTGMQFTTATNITCPATAFEITQVGFYSKSAASSFHNKGYVKINTDAFTIFQLDTDGAALKLITHIDALQLKKAKHNFYAINGKIANEALIPIYNNEETPRREGLPSNRSAGIALAKNGMAEYLNGRFTRMNALKAAMAALGAPPASVSCVNATYILGTEVLTGDDVTIGYRMDVMMTNKPGGADTWHSLHFHENAYSFVPNDADAENVIIDDIGLDEGFIQMSTSKDKNVAGDHMKLSEVIARWEGWSLAAPMPGLSLNEPTLDKTNPVAPSDEAEADKYKTPGTMPFTLNVKPKVAKGTLPRLRFGQNYAIKLRMVDMAGNSVDVDSNPEEFGEALIKNFSYKRYEPVDAPFLIPGNVFTNPDLSDPEHHNFRDGESSEVMVIRSNEGQTVQEYETDPTHQHATQPGAYRDTCTRHVKPPRTTVGMAITHSMLEQAIGQGSVGMKAVYDKIVADKDPEIITDPHTNDIKFDDSTLAAVVNSDDASTGVEYLADPMAAGVQFFISALDPNIKLSGVDVSKYSKRVSFYFDNEIVTEDDANQPFDYDQWMAPKTFRIILKEGDTKVEYSNNAVRIFTVSIPKGFMLKLNYACFWKPKDIIRMSGVLGMMTTADLTEEFKQSLFEGKHWLLSPWRTITFVHAVQQPVTTVFTSPKTLPFINAVTSTRAFGETSAGVNIDLELHGASTGVADLEAEWVDWIDDVNDLTKPGVQLTTKKAKVYHYTTLYDVYKYVFGNFPDHNINNNPFGPIPHQFNDTKHRWVDYTVIASTRYKECFYNLINDAANADDLGDVVKFDITRRSDPFPRVNVLSSARPMAPQVAYVIPVFEWGQQVNGDTIVKGRGCGLRVYVKRPWYSSGEGEKLAVVLLPPPTFGAVGFNTETMDLYCTTWGNDPSKTTPVAGGIFPAKQVFVGVKTGDVDNTYGEDNLSLSEVNGVKVNIVAYDLQYDTDRQLYYADIMINFGVAYFPFVRLALAAYQQHSVRKDGQECCLSKVVRADYIQIPPPRLTSIKRNGTNVTVAISGTLPNLVNRSEYSPVIEFTIEHLEFPRTEGVVITAGAKPIATYQHIILAQELNNFTFNHSHTFDLSGEDPAKPYRVRILEYEMLPYDPNRRADSSVTQALGNMKDRLVFADVYDVNTNRIIDDDPIIHR